MDKKVWSAKICKELIKEYTEEIIALGKRAEDVAKSKGQIVDELPPVLLEFFQKIIAEKDTAERMFALYAIFALGMKIGKEILRLELKSDGDNDDGGGKSSSGGNGRTIH